MNRHLSLLLILATVSFAKTGYSQSAGKPAVSHPWNAQWIAAGHGDNGRGYGVYYFRKNFELPARPDSFLVRVSADNRYKLYVNGTLVSMGPARGDIYYWNYETVDLAPYLTAGKNAVAALVYNEAEYRPEAQNSFRTAFVLQGISAAEKVLDTDDTWKCIRDDGYSPITDFFAASVGERVILKKTVKGWTSPAFDDHAWPPAASVVNASAKGMSDGFGWLLVPSPLPPMELTYQRIPVLRKATGMDAPATFPAVKSPVVIPARTTATLLLDQTYLTNAYVTLDFSKGKDAEITLQYAETLFDHVEKYGTRKSNRNEIEGKDFVGRKDILIADGTDGQTFTTLNFRTYRYLLLTVQTRDEPLILDDLYGTFTGYPFKQTAIFKSDDAEIKKILDIGWRTARLNAFETYTDCPYYEQLQYIGDTRIQAMVSYYYSGDDRLARNAIDLMDHSRLPEGVTLSRYPTHSTQIIPTFSLWYIGMLRDYWMYRADSNFIKGKLVGERAILDFFAKYQQSDGSLKDVPYWNFVDWANGKNWSVGSPPKDAHGSSAILDLQLLWAFQWAAEMEAGIGMPAYATLYDREAARLKETIQRKYWDSGKKLYADTEDKTTFSQHANALAILTGVVPDAKMPALGKKLLTDRTLTQCTIYFKYYLHMALVKAGLGDDYLNWLGIWRENMKMGLTTWAEDSSLQTVRSDCHAWGSSPNIEFFRTVLGIDSQGPGFSDLKIEPHLGTLTKVSGEIPHPNGKVAVAYRLDHGKWEIKIGLPAKTTGTLVWKGKRHVLKAGDNSFVL